MLTPGVPPGYLGLRCVCVAGAALCAQHGSDVCPGVPPGYLGLRCVCVAGAVLCALHGVGCTPWRPSGVPGSPLLLHGRRGTLCSARGRMYALASLRGTWASAAFAWQARRFVLSTGSDVRPGFPPGYLGLRCFCVAGAALCAQHGVGCTPWRPSGVPGSPLLLRGRRGALSSARGRMYALASLRGTWVSAAFAWQARYFVLCTGSDVRPGVPPGYLGLRCFCVAGAV